MKLLLNLITNRTVLSFIGILLLAILIWLAGPYIALGGAIPLESVLSRMLCIGGVFSAWLISVLWRTVRAKKKEAELLSSLADDDGSIAASDDELRELQHKMQSAVDVLKRGNFKGHSARYIYELPWYIIIGPPGAGKTTLLSNSELDFPLEESHGRYSVKGVGGTRNCDWWFTDQAVILDTAGRYATQDSDRSIDSKTWTGFLSLLKEKRKRRPINGVLLALSIQDILESDEDAMTQLARTLRSRVDELYGNLGVSPPIYLIFTKCDLLPGFAEFFADLGATERRQVWGYTLPVDNRSDESEQIAEAFNSLKNTVQKQTIRKLQRELSGPNREGIYSLPLHYTNLTEKSMVFVQQMMSRNRLLENMQFRGVYFTSATQSGSVLDKVINVLSSDMGVGPNEQASAAGNGKSYFINALLSDVIFQESGLAGSSAKVEKRLKFFQIGGIAAILGMLTIGLSSWIVGYTGNKKLIDNTRAQVLNLEDSLFDLPSDSLDIITANRLLNEAQAVPQSFSTGTSSSPSFFVKSTGLFQGTRISQLSANKYDELLIDVLLPRLQLRLENQIHAQQDNPEFLFEALKTYQMLHLRERYAADAIIGWYHFDIDRNLPESTPTQTRQSLRKHITNLFTDRPIRNPRSMDSTLVARYQEVAASLTLENRAYNRIKNRQIDSVNRFIKISAKTSPDISRVLERQDGISFDRSVPEFFTKYGYNQLFLPELPSVADSLFEDNWVLGPFSSATGNTVSAETLQEQVKERYYEDYIASWSTLLTNVQVLPVDDLSGASDLVSLLSDIDSPLKLLLQVAAADTKLTEPETTEQAENNGKGSREKELGSLLETTADAGGEKAEIDPVTRTFTPLHDLVASEGGAGSRLDQLLSQLEDLNVQLLPMAQGGSAATDTRLTTDLAISLKQLSSKADRLPSPLAEVLTGLTGDISDVSSGGFCQQLNTAWQTDVVPYYKRAIRGRYPVSRKGTTDIAMSDFGAFFGKGGIVDQFVDTYLNSVVSKTPQQWTWTGNSENVCLNDNSLKQLAFADDIKNTFFSNSEKLPSFQFELIPNELTMSGEIETLFLSIGGGSTEFFHGPVTGTTSFTWPSTTNNTLVNLRVEPIISGTTASLENSGPWAVLRLFDQGGKRRTGNGVQVDYSFGGRGVTLAFATSSFNPLNSVALRNFRAPENL